MAILCSCLGDVYYTTTDTASDPSGVFYTWTPGGTLSDTMISQPWAHPGGTVVYTLQVGHDICSSIDTVTIGVRPALNPLVESDTLTACEGDTILLTGSWRIRRSPV